MRVLVCGGRDFKRYDIVKKVLSTLDITEMCSGHARGADEDGERYASEFGIPCVLFPANWNDHARSAGPIRNREMLKKFKPDTIVAFPGGNGTADMVAAAGRDPNVYTIILVDADGEVRRVDLTPQPLLIMEWP